MEMKLKQSEIETALRKYVLSILTLAEGSQLAIDFAATRGPEGFTATIDIQPPTEDEPKAELVDEPVPAQATTARKTKPQLTKQAEKPVEEPEPVVATTAQTKVEEKQPEPVVVVEAEPESKDPVVTQKTGTGFPGFASEGEAEPELPPETEALVEEVAQVNDAAEPVKEQAAAEPVKKPSLFANLRGS